MNVHQLAAAVVVVASALASDPSWAQHSAPGHLPGHTMVTPQELKWTDIPSLPPGAKMAVIEGPMNQAVPFTARLRLPANYRIPPHRHPAIEHLTVLSGTFHMGVGETFDPARSTALTAGSMAIMQTGTPHFAWTKDETVLQLHGVGPWGIEYLNPADDPRKR